MKALIAVAIVSSVLALNATEIKSFQGVDFGMKITADKFSGPDEDGDYSFVPAGKSPSPSMQYCVSATCKSKKVYLVMISHVLPAENKREGLSQYYKVLQSGYGKLMTPIRQGTTEWNVAFEALGGAVEKNDFYLWHFKDAGGDTKQVMQLLALPGDGVVTIRIVVEDLALSRMDDGEKKGESLGSEAPTSSASTAKSEKPTLPKLMSFCGIRFGSSVDKDEDLGIENYYQTSDHEMERPFLRYSETVELRATPKSRKTFGVVLTANSSVEDRKAAAKLVEDTVTVLKKKYNVVPVKSVEKRKTEAAGEVVIEDIHVYTFILDGAEIRVEADYNSLTEMVKVIAVDRNLRNEARKEFEKTQRTDSAADVL